MNDRNRKLKQKYKKMKPPMGVFIIRNAERNRCFVKAARDLKATMNSAKFKLGAGMHPNRSLQKEWSERGGESFTIEVLDHLEYDEDDTREDNSKDLSELRQIWMDKLAEQPGMTFYQ